MNVPLYVVQYQNSIQHRLLQFDNVSALCTDNKDLISYHNVSWNNIHFFLFIRQILFHPFYIIYLIYIFLPIVTYSHLLLIKSERNKTFYANVFITVPDLLVKAYNPGNSCLLPYHPKPTTQ